MAWLVTSTWQADGDIEVWDIFHEGLSGVNPEVTHSFLLLARIQIQLYLHMQ